MTEITKEARLLQTFANLADTLVDGYDVVDLLQLLVDSCAELLDTTAAAILLADGEGELDVVASTSEASHLVEVIQLSAEAGPCIECFRTGEVISVPDIATSPAEWSRFRDSALELGFISVHAVPMRLRDATIVLDPPRAGAGREVVERLVELHPRQLVYVACDPVAFARDVGLFRERGYELDELRAYDLFPNTHHVEAVARLRAIV